MEPSPRKPFWRRWFGSRSERAALRFLKQIGYRILARNYTCPLGEIDVIALDGHCVVFVEVRSTENANAEHTAASVGNLKATAVDPSRPALPAKKPFAATAGSLRCPCHQLAATSKAADDLPSAVSIRSARGGKFQSFC